MSSSEKKRGYDQSEKKPVKKPYRKLPFEWRHEGQHIFFFLIYILNWNGVWRLVTESKDNPLPERVSIIHVVVAVITVGYPMIYLQTFIGQYTRKSCLSIGDMLPILYGCGFLMLFIACVRVVIQMRYTTNILYYLLVTIFNKDLPWMHCFDDFYKLSTTCIPQNHLDLCPTIDVRLEPCFNGSTNNSSAYLFRDVFAFRRIALPQDTSIWVPNKAMFFAVHGGLIYILLLITGAKKIRSIDVPIKLSIIIYFGTLFTNIIVACTQRGGGYFFQVVFSRLTLTSLSSLEVWLATFRKIILGMKLCDGGHYLFGAFIPIKKPAPYRALHLVLAYTGFAVVGMIYHNLFAGILYYKTGLRMIDIQWMSSEDVIFVMFPVTLGLQASAYFFCLCYFFVLFIASLHAMILNVIMIEMSITEHFNILEFFSYVRFGISTFLFFSSYALHFTNDEAAMIVIRHQVRAFSISALIMQTCIMQLYGMQRFCDDIHFYFGSPVSRYLRMFWILNPILCSIVFYIELVVYADLQNYLSTLLQCFLVSPLLFCFLWKVFAYARQKNMMGAIRPTDEFGPPDLELKILRVLYNPRTAVRYRRQREICNHVCLNQGEAATVALLDEIELIKKFIEESATFTGEQNLGPKIRHELEKHKALLVHHYNKMIKSAQVHNFNSFSLPKSLNL